MGKILGIIMGQKLDLFYRFVLFVQGDTSDQKSCYYFEVVTSEEGMENWCKGFLSPLILGNDEKNAKHSVESCLP